MKIYTVDRFGIDRFVRVDSYFLPNGKKIPAFVIGEEGRGRKLVFVPVSLTSESQQTWEKDGWIAVENVTYKLTEKGYVHLKELSQPSEDDQYLVILYGWIGYRGSNSLTDADGNPLGKDVILAEGRIAQGDAGRMGAGSQWLLKVRVGDYYWYKVTGRLYGQPGSFVLYCSAKGPVLYTEEVWNVFDVIEA